MNNDQANNVTQKALRAVRARVLEVHDGKTRIVTLDDDDSFARLVNNSDSGMESVSKALAPTETLPEEPNSHLAGGKAVEPPFDMLTLSMLAEHSSELGQCIEAMETNIEATGHRFIPRAKLDDLARDDEKDDGQKLNAEGESNKNRILAEKIKLENFFMYACDESFVQFRRKIRKDLEATGNAYWEVLRGVSGDIVGFVHIPAYQIRLGRLDREPFQYERKCLEMDADGSYKINSVTHHKRFRRFVQSRSHIRGGTTNSSIIGGKLRWFKEFGDPRSVNKETGDYETDSVPVPAAKEASEIFHYKLYSSRTPYGIPRYIGNLLSIFGDRAAEEINYITFRNNNIPSMILMVSNGMLTDGTIARIESFVQSQIQGSDNYSKFLIIEAEPHGEAGEDGGQVKVNAQPMTGSQHSDALFQNYSSNNQDKIRRAFRLPPIFVGRSDDYTRATAEASRVLADEQVFNPERNEFDALINRHFFPEMGIVHHTYKSNSPNTTDNQQIVRILSGAEKTGGMTPRIARAMLEQVLSIDLPGFPSDFPADVPFSLTMAEAVKNQADPAEPGQQVTAIKQSAQVVDTLKALGILDPDGNLDETPEQDEDGNVDVKKTLVKFAALQREVEQLWLLNRNAVEE